jgi:hypothetical protein
MYAGYAWSWNVVYKNTNMTDTRSGTVAVTSAGCEGSRVKEVRVGKAGKDGTDGMKNGGEDDRWNGMGAGTGVENETERVRTRRIELLTIVKERTYANCNGLVGSHVARLPAI